MGIETGDNYEITASIANTAASTLGSSTMISATSIGAASAAQTALNVIDAAIASLVGGDVEGGPSPEVSDCSHYSDSMGHLTSAGSQEAAQQIGTFYLTY